MTSITDHIPRAFWPVLRDIKREAHGEYWFKGGRGSGKSSFVSLAIIRGLLKHPDAHAIIYRRVAATLRESVYEQMAWAIDILGLRPWFQFKISPLEIRYAPTGQRIMFRGADDPSKSKSIKLSSGYFGYLWFEELAEFRGIDDVRSIKASTLRGTNAHTVTFCSYNPPMTARSWVNEEALRQESDRLVHHSSYLDVPPEWLGKRFIADAEALRASNERAYRHMYLGEVTGTGGQVFDNLDVRAITAEEIAGLDRVYSGLDFGFAIDPDAFTRWGYDRKARRLYALAEFYGAHTPTATLAEKVLALAGRDVVRCDSADPRMIAEIRRLGVNAVASKKGPGSREHGFRWLQNLGGIVIDPARTPNIAREFAAYEYAHDAHGNFLAEYPDGEDHSIDSARYALEPEITRRVATTRADIY